MRKRVIGLFLCLAVLLFYPSLPVPEGLGIIGVKTLVLLVIAVLLWITEVIPLGISSIFLLVLPLMMGVSTLKETLTAFPNPTIFFVLATFGISAAISKVPTTIIFIKKAGGKYQSVYFSHYDCNSVHFINYVKYSCYSHVYDNCPQFFDII